MPHHDLVIIGSGSGNSLVTPELDDWDIALVEENTSWFGGTCLNVGCIPTKMYVYPADLAENAAHPERLGLSPGVVSVDWPAIRDRIFGRIDAISAGGREYRRTGSPNVTLYETHAEFSDSGEPRTLQLGTGETLTADHVVIAAGSRAMVPEMVIESGVPFHTSDTIMRLPELPESIVIVGGGYIAAEFAHIFSAFGTHTTVLARSGLLHDQDHEIADRFTDLVREKWHLRVGTHPVGFSHSGSGVRVELADDGSVEADVLLVATGRIPNGDRLAAKYAGVELRADGRVKVDSYQRTTAENIWALGDVSSTHQLKHVANHEARVVAHNLAHPDDLVESDHRFVPSAVFTHPQLASVGITEDAAKMYNRPYVSVTQEYGSTAYGWAMVDTTSVCKLLADPATGQLIGAHLMGEQASTLIQPLIQAMSFGLGVQEMARGQYWIHPALTEVVENALLALKLP
ncbi:mycothione reductase [uncultured Jatrophihabitans sp.]|uniref:mycothione reductase n=1 Tax=uncultured Jatrophihabitans sp. TaxID=1610747 RepID=UPI0035C9FC48